LPKRRKIVIPLSGFIPKADLTLISPAANAYNLELDKTAVENTKKLLKKQLNFCCKQRDSKRLVKLVDKYFCICKQTRRTNKKEM
jgi:hypothetical protein